MKFFKLFYAKIKQLPTRLANIMKRLQISEWNLLQCAGPDPALNNLPRIGKEPARVRSPRRRSCCEDSEVLESNRALCALCPLRATSPLLPAPYCAGICPRLCGKSSASRRQRPNGLRRQYRWKSCCQPLSSQNLRNRAFRADIPPPCSFSPCPIRGIRTNRSTAARTGPCSCGCGKCICASSHRNGRGSRRSPPLCPKRQLNAAIWHLICSTTPSRPRFPMGNRSARHS